MGLVSIVITAFVVALSGALTPGPLTLVTMVRAARNGVKAGMQVCLGHGVVEALLVAALGLGAGAILTRLNLAGVIALVGGVVLAIMGFSLIRDAGATGIEQTSELLAETGSDLGPVAAGIAATVGNPYWIMWWATVGVSYVILASQFGFLGLVLFFGGHYSADVLTMAGFSVLAAQGRRRLNVKWYRRLLLIFGFFLVGMAAYFFYSAWTFWH